MHASTLGGGGGGAITSPIPSENYHQMQGWSVPPSFRKLACENEGGGGNFRQEKKKKGSREGSRGHTRCAREGEEGRGGREKLGGGAVCYGKFWSGGGVGREGGG